MILNQATCVNRLNPGQLFELSLNFIASNITKYLLTFAKDIDICIDTLKRFFDIVSDDYSRYLISNIDSCINDDEAAFTVYDCLAENGDGLYIPLEPITECITLDTLMDLYKEFPWITPVFMDVPIRGSRGQIRFVQSKKPSIVAKQYIYRMKQNAEEKHSSTSMSATNVRCLNSKSKAAKMFIRTHSNTPIRFGEMENSIFMLMGAEIQVQNLMIYSTSPQGRRDAKQMLESYEFNVTLGEDGKSRSAEILNAIIKAMGLKFEFKKIPIKYKEIGHEQQDCALFHFLDLDNNPLFRKCGIDEAKLIKQCESTPELFVELGDNHDKLFEYKGD